uniref:Uncharacterized protein n=1 Tax=Equus asinus TaxID=9793 RepID=A0A8C4MC39_EQUAS
VTSRHLIMTRTRLQVWFSSSTQVWKIRWRLCNAYLWKRGDGERNEERNWREKKLVFAEADKPSNTRECHIWETPREDLSRGSQAFYLFVIYLSIRPAPSPFFFPKVTS